MAHLKQANAMVVHPRVSGRGWSKVRRAARQDIRASDFTDQAREILGGTLDPDRYLFTHCTIVASVDVESAPGAKLGKVRVGSKDINRKYADYLIKPACNQFVNNNGDSWSRSVLKKSFHTFIGGQNYQEHVQIPEKSKGRILDAVSRDIGDSLYIDILVATDRKHTQLVKDILTQDMKTLSMGCTTDFTICSKCGHVAADETELCECISYEKLNTFIDDMGMKRVVAELCGHESCGKTGGVRFIEASWVGTPAFEGAVLRNILSLGDTGRAESEIRKILASPPPSANWSEGAMMKAASYVRVAEFEGDGETPEEAPAPVETKAPFQDIEDSVYQSISDRVKKRIQKDLAPPALEPPPADTNNTLIKSSSKIGADAYKRSILAACRVARSQAAVVNAASEINEAFGLKVNRDLYRIALNIGPIKDPTVYMAACQKSAGHPLSKTDTRVLIRLGCLLAQWEDQNRSPRPSQE